MHIAANGKRKKHAIVTPMDNNFSNSANRFSSERYLLETIERKDGSVKSTVAAIVKIENTIVPASVNNAVPIEAVSYKLPKNEKNEVPASAERDRNRINLR